MNSPASQKNNVASPRLPAINHGTRSQKIDEACADWGFFELTNHPLLESSCKGLLEQMHLFSSLPLREKKIIERTSENHWGFYDQELTKRSKPHYRSINWGDFREKREAGDYANYGNEIQIDNFRISGR